MPMIAGSVSIAPDGTATGTGYAKAVYDELAAATDFQGSTPPGLVVAKEQLATIANAVSSLITHVQTTAVVSTTDDGSAGAIAWAGAGTGTIA